MNDSQEKIRFLEAENKKLNETFKDISLNLEKAEDQLSLKDQTIAGSFI